MISFRPSTARFAFWLIIAMIALAAFALSAPAAASASAPAGVPEISNVLFEGNNAFGASELRAQLSTKETPGFFNKFLNKSISEKLGRKDEFLNLITVGADLQRLRDYYRNRGFADVKVDTMLEYSGDGEHVAVTFKIDEGYRSLLDTLEYRGISDQPATIWQDIRSAPRISQGDPYNLLLLEEEVHRVLGVFSDNGFPRASFVRDSSRVVRLSSTRNYSAVLTFLPGKRYLFGEINVSQKVDSLRGERRRDDLTDELVLRYLDYKEGNFFSLESKTKSERNLRRLGVYDIDSIALNIPPLADTANKVSSTIVIRPRDRHEIAPELVASNENDAFNLGVGMGYTRRNFLGGARILSTHLRFRTQTLTAFPDYFAQSTDAVSNMDMTAELLQPYLFSNDVKATWSFSYIVDKQVPYKMNIFRNRFSVSNRFAEFTTGLTEWTMESIGIHVRSIPASQMDAEEERQLELLPIKQFNSILSFTMQRDMTNALFSPSSGFIHSMTVQESGLFPQLASVEKKLFTQFYSISGTGRWYSDLSRGRRFSILAVKVKGGVEEKYGASRSDSARTIPQTNLFFAGGSGSIRGWSSRGLIARGNPELGGEIQLEGSVELRMNPLQALHDDLFDKLWTVQFVDAGNLWPSPDVMQIRDIAIAAGMGIRYETFFGPFRVDWGLRIYNPRDPDGRYWITQRKFIGQTLKEGVFHFGIGDAF